MNTIFALLMLLTPDNLDNPTFRVMATFNSIDECEATVAIQTNKNIIPLLKCFEMRYNKTNILPEVKEEPVVEPAKPCKKCKDT